MNNRRVSLDETQASDALYYMIAAHDAYYGPRENIVDRAESILTSVLKQPGVLDAVKAYIDANTAPSPATQRRPHVYTVELRHSWLPESVLDQVFINGVPIGYVQTLTYVDPYTPNAGGVRYIPYVGDRPAMPGSALPDAASFEEAREMVARVWLERHGLELRQE